MKTSEKRNKNEKFNAFQWSSDYHGCINFCYVVFLFKITHKLKYSTFCLLFSFSLLISLIWSLWRTLLTHSVELSGNDTWIKWNSTLVKLEEYVQSSPFFISNEEQLLFSQKLYNFFCSFRSVCAPVSLQMAAGFCSAYRGCHRRSRSIRLKYF